MGRLEHKMLEYRYKVKSTELDKIKMMNLKA